MTLRLPIKVRRIKLNTRVKIPDVNCAEPMNSLMNCMSKNNASDALCGKEVQEYVACVATMRGVKYNKSNVNAQLRAMSAH